MVRAGCVFVAGIHPSRTWTSGSVWVRAMNCMCAQTRPRFILSSEGVLGGMEFEPMLTPREKSPLPENVPRGVSNPRHCGSEPKHYQLSYSGPICAFQCHYHHIVNTRHWIFSSVRLLNKESLDGLFWSFSKSVEQGKPRWLVLIIFQICWTRKA